MGPISSYRLGDLVNGLLIKKDRRKLMSEHPNSIAAKFFNEKQNDPERESMDILKDIVLQECEKNIDKFPKDIADSTVIHLRLGDVVAGHNWHEKEKRPLPVTHLKEVLLNDKNKKYVIGKCFFASPSSKNFKQCIDASNKYLNEVMAELQAEHLNTDDADLDLCVAVKSKLFVQGKGNYSNIIVNIRKKLNLENIELTT